MKVLQVSNVHYIRGGADKVYFDTADLLEENGHSVAFFSTQHPENRSTPYEKYFVGTNEFFDRKNFAEKLGTAQRYLKNKEAALKLEQLLIDHQPDLAHVHIFQNQLSNSILPVFRKFKIPVVMSVHEYKMLCPIYTFLDPDGNVCEKCAGGSYHHCITKKCNKDQLSYSTLASVESYMRDYFTPYEKYIDHFLMVSNFIREKHIEYKSVFGTKSSCLYNFLDISDYEPEELEKKEDYYVYFGRLSREKGILTMLETFEKLPQIKLKIIGDGQLKPEIESRIREMGMQNVELLGFRSGRELWEIITRARFSIVPSEWYETFGLIIIEAMALKTPVIGAEIGAIPELIEENKNGFLFESKNPDSLYDAIKYADELSQAEYQVMAENARKFVESKFLKDLHYNQLLKVYEKVIEDYGKN